MIGELVARLDAEGMTDNTVLIVTADHGGLDNAHGGDSAFERTTPMIFYGRGVTPGKVIEPALLICDVAATVGGLLGVELPRECVGKFVAEAFTPRDGDRCYVPMPRIAPAGGLFREPVEVTLAADAEGAEIRYTLDGTEPDPHRPATRRPCGSTPRPWCVPWPAAAGSAAPKRRRASAWRRKIGRPAYIINIGKI